MNYLDHKKLAEIRRLYKKNSDDKLEWFELLKFVRLSNGYSLRDISKIIGISNVYLCQLENGKVKEPGFFIMMKLLNQYNLIADIKDIKEIAGIKE